VVATTEAATTVAPTTTTTVAPTTTTVAPTTTTVAPTTTTVAPTTTVAAPVVLAAPPLVTPVTALRLGAAGPAVVALQQRLLDLGFWLDDVDGRYGGVTRQAVMAFQKHLRLPASGTVDARTATALNEATTRVAGLGISTDGDLVEVDKGRQVLYLLRGGTTVWAFNVSTGTEKEYTEPNQKTGEMITDVAHTPVGVFKIYREYTDGWEFGQLGELYRPKYFKGGVAIHGHGNVPNVPASHGCVRISLEAMDWMWANDVLPRGMRVWVHD
jgi:peptidoglycan hydrolase-like protein with peptidoglycan-binding domain